MEKMTIQFITDERLMIPGSGGVGVRGGLLEIGPGLPGQMFPYRSPREQIKHYGKQHYVLITVTDEEGEEIDHPDLGVTLVGSIVEPEDAADEPTGTHEVLKQLSMDPSIKTSAKPKVEEDSADEDTKKTSTRKTSSKRSTTRKASAKKK